jgi:hypothetical protein
MKDYGSCVGSLQDLGYQHIAVAIPPGLALEDAVITARLTRIFVTAAGCGRASVKNVHPAFVARRETLVFACEAEADLRYMLRKIDGARRVGYRVVEALRPEATSANGGTA